MGRGSERLAEQVQIVEDLKERKRNVSIEMESEKSPKSHSLGNLDVYPG
jgi:hypothetical protein